MKKKGLLYGSFIMLFAAIISKIAGLLFKIPLTNLLGGSGMGYFSSAYSVYTPIYAVFGASITPAIAQYISSRVSKKAGRRPNCSVKTLLIFFGGISLAITVALMLLARMIAKFIIGSPNSAAAIIAIAPCIFIEAITSVLRGHFEGRSNYTPTAVSQITESVTRVICGLGFAYIARNEEAPIVAAAAVWGVTASNLAGLIYLIAKSIFTKEPLTDNSCRSSDIGMLKDITALVLPISLTAIASSLMSAIDTFTILAFTRSSIASNSGYSLREFKLAMDSGVNTKDLPDFLYGTYTGLSCTVFALAPSLCGVFGRTALPVISKHRANSDSESMKKEIKRVIMMTVYVAVPAGLGLSAFSNEVLSLLYAARPAEVAYATKPLMLLSLGTVFLSLSNTAFSILQAVGRQEMPAKITTLGAIIKLILNTLLIKGAGLSLVGAAIASVISYVIMCTIAISVLYRETKVKLTPMCSIICPIFVSVISVASAKIAEYLIQDRLSRPLCTAISIAFAVIIYIFLAVLLDISTKNKISEKIFAK